MDIENKRLKTSFTLPDRLTVRQQLAYFSEASSYDSSKVMERLWRAATQIIQNWKSEHLDLKSDIDTLTDPKATDVIIWAALEVKKYINDLDKTPKN